MGSRRRLRTHVAHPEEEHLVQLTDFNLKNPLIDFPREVVDFGPLTDYVFKKSMAAVTASMPVH
jgi:hypothetical protein